MANLDDPNDPLPEGKVVLNEQGDPVGMGTRMFEKESYERIIEGLKIIGEAAAHLEREEPDHSAQWRASVTLYDQLRKMAIQKAGLQFLGTFKETADPGALTMQWAIARERLRYGGKQAAGGARQMATCFRSDASWSFLASELEKNIEKMLALANGKISQARKAGVLWVPNSGGVN